MSKLNKEVFCGLVKYITTDREPGYIYQRRFHIDNYEYDYSHAIVSYLKASGCRIHRTNHNVFGGFYVYHTAKTIEIDPEVFLETYKGGIHLDGKMKGLLWLFIIGILIPLILIFIFF